MSGKSLAISLMLSCVIALGIGKAEAGELRLEGSISGSIVNTQDTNGDGLKGFLASGGYKGTLGPFTFQTVKEHEFKELGTCPNGEAGVILTMVPGTGHRVARRDRTGELIFFEYTSGRQCIDSEGIVSLEGTDKVTGGTGRFEGATGSGAYSITGKILFQDAAGNFFGEFSGTYEGTIITPSQSRRR